MAISYEQGSSSTPLLAETIGSNLEKTVSRFGDREALVAIHQSIRLTYNEFNKLVDDLALGLLNEGFTKGDRIGIWSPNRYEWAIVQYATAKIGVILVNINPAYRTFELEYVLDQSGCSAIFAMTSFKTSDYSLMINEVKERLPGLRRVFLFEDSSYSDLLVSGAKGDREQLRSILNQLDFDDPINIQYTSGTTGFPKGATLSHHNILNNGYFVGETCKYTEFDSVVIPVPYYHCFGMVMGNLACTSHGSKMIIPSFAFEPKAALSAVTTETATSLYGVPTMFIAELADPTFGDYDLSSLRTGIMAGSPCPVEVMKQVVSKMNMSQVTICYGMTETSPVSTQTKVDDEIEKRVGSVGRVLPHLEVKVVDSDGHCVERGVPGEFLTRGYSVMLGYWNDSKKTTEAIDPARWMHTGDLAIMDEDGFLNIVGRAKDMIIRGGENIYPREIEEFLYSHPDIMDVSVIGIPDPVYGEVVMAWITLKEGANLTQKDIHDYCEGKIAHYKVPKVIKFVSEFPMTVTGKVQKYVMRQQAIAELGLAPS
ncbi:MULTISPECIES: AMP-binding protein [Acidithrix]|uniref:Long-chain-fatty-acid--CoA ligase n=1 Tax=Acidithrix ferrooxidans TaxID=1280514 RepID=A0A0D8HIV8_9ACTN|nr:MULTISPECIES: AMP-binding protein [Acidithrix]KJF17016.1 long-chain-fatty-acid--CoA ligase [Acidithrix ferrooxidans]